MTATFSLTSDQAITGAMQLCQALGQGESPTAQDKVDCLVFLQAMLKYWNTEGYKNWLYTTISFASVAAKPFYTIGEAGADVTARRPVKIPMGYMRDSASNDQPLTLLTRQQFEVLTPKNVAGLPNSFYYDPQLVKGVLYPWPIPSNTLQTFYFLTQRPIEDLGVGGSATFDVEQEWYLAIIWGLADQIALLMGTSKDVRDEITRKAPDYLAKAADFSEEDGSVFFQPDPRGGFAYARG